MMIMSLTKALLEETCRSGTNEEKVVEVLVVSRIIPSEWKAGDAGFRRMIRLFLGRQMIYFSGEEGDRPLLETKS